MTKVYGLPPADQRAMSFLDWCDYADWLDDHDRADPEEV